MVPIATPETSRVHQRTSHHRSSTTRSAPTLISRGNTSVSHLMNKTAGLLDVSKTSGIYDVLYMTAARSDVLSACSLKTEFPSLDQSPRGSFDFQSFKVSSRF